MSRTLRRGFYFVPSAIACVAVLAMLSEGAWLGAAACALSGGGAVLFLHRKFVWSVRLRLRRITRARMVTFGGVHENAASAIEQMQAVPAD